MFKKYTIENTIISSITIIFKEKIEEIILSNPEKDSKIIAYEKYGNLEDGENKCVLSQVKEIKNYFKNKKANFNLNCLNLDKITSFQKSVLIAQSKTSFGDINYYKDIAIRINNEKSSRAVGNALRNNPFAIIIPCHRTIKSNNEIGGFSGFVKDNDFKKILLEHEGHEIINNKCIK